MKDYICKCGAINNIVLRQSGTATGIYCQNCGRWFKWAAKDEINEIKFKDPNVKQLSGKTKQAISTTQDVRSFIGKTFYFVEYPICGIDIYCDEFKEGNCKNCKNSYYIIRPIYCEKILISGNEDKTIIIDDIGRSFPLNTLSFTIDEARMKIKQLKGETNEL